MNTTRPSSAKRDVEEILTCSRSYYWRDGFNKLAVSEEVFTADIPSVQSINKKEMSSGGIEGEGVWYGGEGHVQVNSREEPFTGMVIFIFICSLHPSIHSNLLLLLPTNINRMDDPCSGWWFSSRLTFGVCNIHKGIVQKQICLQTNANCSVCLVTWFPSNHCLPLMRLPLVLVLCRPEKEHL